MARFGLFVLILVSAGCEKIELERAGGPKLNWDQLRGQWVLVNYWAEWCKPCLEEIPELNELDKAPDIAVLGVNFDGISGVELEELGERMGIEFTMLAEDPGHKFGWQTPVALPATFVVNPDGDLLEARFGPQTEADIRALIGG
ncbi:TlpA disulfide reductase family protein [Marinobacter sp. M216]|uniref:TlpA disulfide reductase family protein n=2 Tax=Marinobacteraceae TaxID=2887365 RepID=A0ABT7HH27_9GAMM|nr:MULTISPECIES: TlpA disulfide reductase family protein [unclassified Marinobacter]MBW7469392.1 TlpA family protein disulfide reductase [Marinobacter sp. F4218]MDK9559691.1 TlpA disulfide reductase family protein [Marinobacter sp. M216]